MKRPGRCIACALGSALIAAHGLFAIPALAGATDAELAPVASGVDVAAPVELTVANRPITTFRAEIYGVDPAERARAVEERIVSIVDDGGRLVVTTKVIPDGTAVLINDAVVFRVLAEDLDPDSTQTTATVAKLAAQRLQLALGEIEESRDATALLPAIAASAAATAVLFGVLWLLVRLQRWIAYRAHRLLQKKTDELASRWTGHLIGRSAMISLVTVPIRVFILLVGLLVVYEYAGFVLGQFPYTRPWGETLQGNLLSALGGFGSRLLRALPGLLFVALIFTIARLVVRAVRAFFAAVQAGRVHVNWVDETTARPTGQLASVLIWLFAIVAAYPYIPGSESEAFKGLGVFVGLMLSIGSSGIVNQAVSGLMLMYTRSLKPGEYVRIGEIEGTVTSVGFLTTRLESLRHEEFNVPNAVITSTTTRNYSRLAASSHLEITTSVTIGYDTPWRQVNAMLLTAATRTNGIVGTPASRVHQSSLGDFYVEYTLIVAIAEPRQRAVILSELHGHVQDVFNEHGVQIMSPHYETDPDSPKMVSREEWFRAPATRDDRAPGGSGARTPD